MEVNREKKSANSMTESTYFDTECMWWWMCKQPHSAPEVGPCIGLVSKSVESYWFLIASASVFLAWACYWSAWLVLRKS